MKTGEDWFAYLPEPYYSQALTAITEQNKERKLRTKYDSLVKALWHVFVWEYTPQGHMYWRKLTARAECGEFSTGPTGIKQLEEVKHGGDI